MSSQHPAITADVIRDKVLSMCMKRGSSKTICPSEVARSLFHSEPEWRAAMPLVREVAFGMHKDGIIRICQRGKPLAATVTTVEQLRGPIRLQFVQLP
jgi:hypothetical protein